MAPSKRKNHLSIDAGNSKKSIKLYYTQRKSGQTVKRTDKLVKADALEPVEDELLSGNKTLAELLPELCPSGHDRIAEQVNKQVTVVKEQLRLNSLDRQPYEALLAALLEHEARRLRYGKTASKMDFTRWLSQANVLDTLLACHLVYHGIAKPAELDSVSAFDAVLLIESVVKCTHPHSSTGVERLRRWEEMLLVAPVWTGTGRLYELIEAERKNSSTKPKVRAEVDVLASPRKALQAMTNSGPSNTRLTPLDLFFRKYFRLVVARLDSLAHGLDLPEPVQDALWQAFLALVERVEPEKRLLQHRHLHQILAALVYSVCKYYDRPVTFKQIIGVLGGNATLYKRIWMGEGHEPVDLVSFYNAAFLPAMQQVIHSLPLNHAAHEPDDGAATVPGSPAVTPRRRQEVMQQPSLHSPINGSSHLSRHVMLTRSPMKHSLSRQLAGIHGAGTPTKLLHVLHAVQEMEEADVENKQQTSGRATRSTRKASVSRRLDF